MECDIEGCKNKAAYNLQSGLILWAVKANGNYSKNPIEISTDDDINEHLCEEHYDESEHRI